MKSRLANIPARVWGLLALPLVVLAGPVAATVGSHLVRAVVPEAVRAVLRML